VVAECLQDRLRGRPLAIEPLQRLAPPGKLDAADHRLAAAGEDRAQGCIQSPQGRQARPQGRANIAQRKDAVVIEI
jgi:hypothetical protein